MLKTNQHMFHPIIRIISLVLIISFIAYDISWANPDAFQTKTYQQNNKLAPHLFTKQQGAPAVFHNTAEKYQHALDVLALPPAQIESKFKTLISVMKQFFRDYPLLVLGIPLIAFGLALWPDWPGLLSSACEHKGAVALGAVVLALVAALSYSGRSDAEDDASAQAEPVDAGEPLVSTEVAKEDSADKMVKELRNCVPGHEAFFDKAFNAAYMSSKKLGFFNNKSDLALFMDAVFEKAKERPGYVHNTRIVFLSAGADPLYEMAKQMARVDLSSFPEERIHKVWATMGNLAAIKYLDHSDPVQASLFIKYLYDQGILSSDTERIIFVDTDSRHGGPGHYELFLGTELLIYKTLLDRDVIDDVNKRFGLNLNTWNTGGPQELDMFYLYNAGRVTEDGLSRTLARFGINVSDYNERMHVETFKRTERIPRPEKDRSILGSYYEVTTDGSRLWEPIDRFAKIETIEDRFVLQDGIAKPVFIPSHGQQYSGVELLLCRHLQYAGIIMQTLQVLEARGFNVSSERERYVAELRSAFETVYKPEAPVAPAAVDPAALKVEIAPPELRKKFDDMNPPAGMVQEPGPANGKRQMAEKFPLYEKLRRQLVSSQTEMVNEIVRWHRDWTAIPAEKLMPVAMNALENAVDTYFGGNANLRRHVMNFVNKAIWEHMGMESVIRHARAINRETGVPIPELVSAGKAAIVEAISSFDGEGELATYTSIKSYDAMRKFADAEVVLSRFTSDPSDVERTVTRADLSVYPDIRKGVLDILYRRLTDKKEWAFRGKVYKRIMFLRIIKSVRTPSIDEVAVELKMPPEEVALMELEIRQAMRDYFAIAAHAVTSTRALDESANTGFESPANISNQGSSDETILFDTVLFKSDGSDNPVPYHDESKKGYEEFKKVMELLRGHGFIQKDENNKFVIDGVSILREAEATYDNNPFEFFFHETYKNAMYSIDMEWHKIGQSWQDRKRETRLRKGAEMRLRAVLKDSKLYIEIIDNGSGFSPGTLARAGRKEGSAWRRKTCGKALTLINRMVERVGWELHIENRRDTKGAVVALVIPQKAHRKALRAPNDKERRWIEGAVRETRKILKEDRENRSMPHRDANEDGSNSDSSGLETVKTEPSLSALSSLTRDESGFGLDKVGVALFAGVIALAAIPILASYLAPFDWQRLLPAIPVIGAFGATLFVSGRGSADEVYVKKSLALPEKISFKEAVRRFFKNGDLEAGFWKAAPPAFHQWFLRRLAGAAADARGDKRKGPGMLNTTDFSKPTVFRMDKETVVVRNGKAFLGYYRRSLAGEDNTPLSPKEGVKAIKKAFGFKDLYRDSVRDSSDVHALVEKYDLTLEMIKLIYSNNISWTIRKTEERDYEILRLKLEGYSNSYIAQEIIDPEKEDEELTGSRVQQILARIVNVVEAAMKEAAAKKNKRGFGINNPALWAMVGLAAFAVFTGLCWLAGLDWTGAYAALIAMLILSMTAGASEEDGNGSGDIEALLRKLEKGKLTIRAKWGILRNLDAALRKPDAVTPEEKRIVTLIEKEDDTHFAVVGAYLANILGMAIRRNHPNEDWRMKYMADSLVGAKNNNLALSLLHLWRGVINAYLPMPSARIAWEAHMRIFCETKDERVMTQAAINLEQLVTMVKIPEDGIDEAICAALAVLNEKRSPKIIVAASSLLWTISHRAPARLGEEQIGGIINVIPGIAAMFSDTKRKAVANIVSGLRRGQPNIDSSRQDSILFALSAITEALNNAPAFRDLSLTLEQAAVLRKFLAMYSKERKVRDYVDIRAIQSIKAAVRRPRASARSPRPSKDGTGSGGASTPDMNGIAVLGGTAPVLLIAIGAALLCDIIYALWENDKYEALLNSHPKLRRFVKFLTNNGDNGFIYRYNLTPYPSNLVIGLFIRINDFYKEILSVPALVAKKIAGISDAQRTSDERAEAVERNAPRIDEFRRTIVKFLVAGEVALVFLYFVHAFSGWMFLAGTVLMLWALLTANDYVYRSFSYNEGEIVESEVLWAIVKEFREGYRACNEDFSTSIVVKESADAISELLLKIDKAVYEWEVDASELRPGDIFRFKYAGHDLSSWHMVDFANPRRYISVKWRPFRYRFFMETFAPGRAKRVVKLDVERGKREAAASAEAEPPAASMETQEDDGSKPLGMGGFIYRTFERLGFSPEATAKISFLAEELIFSVFFMNLLPWFLAVLGFPDLSTADYFQLFLTSNILYGLSHNTLYKWRGDQVVDAGPAKWHHKIGFMALGSFFRIGYLIPVIGSWLGPILAMYLHGVWNNVFAETGGFALGLMGKKAKRYNSIYSCAEFFLTLKAGDPRAQKTAKDLFGYLLSADEELRGGISNGEIKSIKRDIERRGFQGTSRGKVRKIAENIIEIGASKEKAATEDRGKDEVTLHSPVAKAEEGLIRYILEDSGIDPAQTGIQMIQSTDDIWWKMMIPRWFSGARLNLITPVEAARKIKKGSEFIFSADSIAELKDLNPALKGMHKALADGGKVVFVQSVKPHPNVFTQLAVKKGYVYVRDVDCWCRSRAEEERLLALYATSSPRTIEFAGNQAYQEYIDYRKKVEVDMGAEFQQLLASSLEGQGFVIEKVGRMRDLWVDRKDDARHTRISDVNGNLYPIPASANTVKLTVGEAVFQAGCDVPVGYQEEDVTAVVVVARKGGAEKAPAGDLPAYNEAAKIDKDAAYYLDNDLKAKLCPETISALNDAIAMDASRQKAARLRRQDETVRTVMIDLPEPVIIDGRIINALKVKGVCFDQAEALQEFTIESMTAMIRIKPDGGYVEDTVMYQPRGGMLFQEAHNQYLVMRRTLAEGVPGNYPAGFGEYRGKSYRGWKIGFVIEGVEDPANTRFVEAFAELIGYGKMGEDGIRVEVREKKMAAHKDEILRLAAECGRELRRLHDAGIYHGWIHGNNIQLTDGRVEYCDFEDSFEDSRLTFKQKVGYRLYDLRLIMHALPSHTAREVSDSLKKLGIPFADTMMSAYFGGAPGWRDCITENSIEAALAFLENEELSAINPVIRLMDKLEAKAAARGTEPDSQSPEPAAGETGGNQPLLEAEVLRVLPEDDQRRIDMCVRFIEHLMMMAAVPPYDLNMMMMKASTDLVGFEGISGEKILALFDKLKIEGADVTRFDSAWCDEAIIFLAAEHELFADAKVFIPQFGYRVIHEICCRGLPVNAHVSRFISLVTDTVKTALDGDADYRSVMERLRDDLEAEKGTEELLAGIAFQDLMDHMALSAERRDDPKTAGKARALLDAYARTLLVLDPAKHAFLFNRSMVEGFLESEYARKNNVGVVYLLSGSYHLYNQAVAIAEASGADASRMHPFYFNRRIADGDPELLREYIEQSGLAEYDTLVIVDTGMLGTMAQRLYDLLDALPRSPVKVYGRLLAMNPAKKPYAYGRMKVAGWNNVLEGLIPGYDKLCVDKNAVMAKILDNSFPADFRSPTRLVKLDDGRVVPDLKPVELPVLQGICREAAAEWTARSIAARPAYPDPASGMWDLWLPDGAAENLRKDSKPAAPAADIAAPKASFGAKLFFTKEAAHVISEEVMDRIGKLVTWKDFTPDEISGRRVAVIRLKGPVVIGGKTINAIEIKGVCYRDEEKGPAGPPRAEIYRGRKTHTIPTEVLLFNEDGCMVEGSVPERKFCGLHLMSSVNREFSMMSDAFRDGLSGACPLGYGEYSKDTFGGLDAGFIIRGVSGDEERLSDTTVRLIQKLGFSLGNDRKEMLKKARRRMDEYLYQYGKILRRFNDMGYIHCAPHVGNILVAPEPALLDFEGSMRKSALTPGMSLGNQMADIWRAASSIRMNLEKGLVIGDLAEWTGADLLRQFFRGYFSELAAQEVDKLKFAGLEELFVHGEDRPFAEIDNPFTDAVKKIIARERLYLYGVTFEFRGTWDADDVFRIMNVVRRERGILETMKMRGMLNVVIEHGASKEVERELEGDTLRYLVPSAPLAEVAADIIRDLNYVAPPMDAMELCLMDELAVFNKEMIGRGVVSVFAPLFYMFFMSQFAASRHLSPEERRMLGNIAGVIGMSSEDTFIDMLRISNGLGMKDRLRAVLDRAREDTDHFGEAFDMMEKSGNSEDDLLADIEDVLNASILGHLKDLLNAGRMDEAGKYVRSVPDESTIIYLMKYQEFQHASRQIKDIREYMFYQGMLFGLVSEELRPAVFGAYENDDESRVQFEMIRSISGQPFKRADLYEIKRLYNAGRTDEAAERVVSLMDSVNESNIFASVLVNFVGVEGAAELMAACGYPGVAWDIASNFRALDVPGFAYGKKATMNDSRYEDLREAAAATWSSEFKASFISHLEGIEPFDQETGRIRAKYLESMRSRGGITKPGVGLTKGPALEKTPDGFTLTEILAGVTVVGLFALLGVGPLVLPYISMVREALLAYFASTGITGSLPDMAGYSSVAVILLVAARMVPLQLCNNLIKLFISLANLYKDIARTLKEPRKALALHDIPAAAILGKDNRSRQPITIISAKDVTGENFDKTVEFVSEYGLGCSRQKAEEYVKAYHGRDAKGTGGLFVACAGEDIVGLVLYSVTSPQGPGADNPFGGIDRIDVRPDYRKWHIATTLVNRAAGRLVEMGIDNCLILIAVDDDAQAFWKKLIPEKYWKLDKNGKLISAKLPVRELIFEDGRLTAPEAAKKRAAESQKNMARLPVPVNIGGQVFEEIPCHENVFIPTDFSGALMKALDAVDIKGRKALDFGCGTGCVTLKAIEKEAGVMEACDMSDEAVWNTRRTFEYCGIKDRAKVFSSFGLAECGKYDVIMANLAEPEKDTEPKEKLRYTMIDRKITMPYAEFEEFLKELPGHLNEGGFALLRVSKKFAGIFGQFGLVADVIYEDKSDPMLTVFRVRPATVAVETGAEQAEAIAGCAAGVGEELRLMRADIEQGAYGNIAGRGRAIRYILNKELAAYPDIKAEFEDAIQEYTQAVWVTGENAGDRESALEAVAGAEKGLAELVGRLTEKKPLKVEILDPNSPLIEPPGGMQRTPRERDRIWNELRAKVTAWFCRPGLSTFLDHGIIVEKDPESGRDSRQIILRACELSELEGKERFDVTESLVSWLDREPLVHSRRVRRMIAALRYSPENTTRSNRYYLAISSPEQNGGARYEVEGFVEADNRLSAICCLEIRSRNRDLNQYSLYNFARQYKGIGRQLLAYAANRESLDTESHIFFDTPGAIRELDKEGFEMWMPYSRKEVEARLRIRDAKTLENLRNSAETGDDGAKGILEMLTARSSSAQPDAAATMADIVASEALTVEEIPHDSPLFENPGGMQKKPMTQDERRALVEKLAAAGDRSEMESETGLGLPREPSPDLPKLILKDIRKARIEDAVSIKRLSDNLYDEEHREDFQFYEDVIRRSIEENDSCMLVCCPFGEGVAGYIYGRENPVKGCFEILEVVTRKDLQDKRIGTSLFTALLDEVKRGGQRRFRVLASAEETAKIAIRLGFVRKGSPGGLRGKYEADFSEKAPAITAGALFAAEQPDAPAVAQRSAQGKSGRTAPEESSLIAAEVGRAQKRMLQLDEELRSEFIARIRGLSGVPVTLELLRGALNTNKGSIFGLIEQINAARTTVALLNNDFDTYMGLHRNASPDCGLCIGLAEVLKDVFAAIGITVKICHIREQNKAVHTYLIVESDHGDIAVDAASGQFIPEYSGHIAVVEKEEYQNAIFAAIEKLKSNPGNSLMMLCRATKIDFDKMRADLIKSILTPDSKEMQNTEAQTGPAGAEQELSPGNFAENAHEIDMHVHSAEEGGDLSVEEIIDQAVKKGMGAIAIVNRNGVEASLKALEIVAQRGYELKIIPGCETSTLDSGIRRDILVYFPKTELFMKNAERIAVTIPAQDSPTGEVIAWAHKFCGVTIYAHPCENSQGAINVSRIHELFEAGLDGLEADHRLFRRRITDRLLEIIDAWNNSHTDDKKIYTVGSDYRRSLYKGQQAELGIGWPGRRDNSRAVWWEYGNIIPPLMQKARDIARLSGCIIEDDPDGAAADGPDAATPKSDFDNFLAKAEAFSGLLGQTEPASCDLTDRGLILYADDILDRGAVADLKETLAKAKTSDGTKIIVYGRKPGYAELLEKVVRDANGSIEVIRIDSLGLKNQYGGDDLTTAFPDEAHELDCLIRLAASNNIGNGKLLGVVRGRVSMAWEGREEELKQVAVDHKTPVAYFETSEGMYSFDEALSALVAAKNVENPTKNDLFRRLRPLDKASVEIQKAYDDYIVALAAMVAA